MHDRPQEHRALRRARDRSHGPAFDGNCPREAVPVGDRLPGRVAREVRHRLSTDGLGRSQAFRTVSRFRMPSAASSVIVSLMLASCMASPPSARLARRAPPVSASGPGLATRVRVRALTAHSVSLVVYLVARHTLPMVGVRVASPDRQLVVPPGCTFRPLSPPHVSQSPRARKAPLPRPVVPMCSLVLSAARPGPYPVDIRVVDRAGRDIAAPIHTLIRIPPRR